ncbi:hypothetical protein G3M48_010109 [Beauveria asiatica]|uniref:Uncharacterized protein n=1 Tax=Beauveria asiatica TaxID=1069075 RepID=A0AAW0RI49_9HYPO
MQSRALEMDASTIAAVIFGTVSLAIGLIGLYLAFAQLRVSLLRVSLRSMTIRRHVESYDRGEGQQSHELATTADRGRVFCSFAAAAEMRFLYSFENTECTSDLLSPSSVTNLGSTLVEEDNLRKNGAPEIPEKPSNGHIKILEVISAKGPATSLDEEQSLESRRLAVFVALVKVADADQAVSDCIIEKVISGTPDEEGQAVEEDQAADEDKPAAAGPRPTMSAACVKASEDFKNVVDADSHCDDTEPDSTNEVERRDSATCSAATAAFEKAWKEDSCEAQLQAELTADSA